MQSMRKGAALAFVVLAGCGGMEPSASADGASADTTATAATEVVCDADNGGITLPAGFCAVVVSDDVTPGSSANARHIAVAPNGDVYVAVAGVRDAETPSDRGGVVALRDTTGDGKADVRVTFGPQGGTGMEVQDGYLYFATNSAVLRYRLGDALEPASGPDTLVHGLPDRNSHTAKSIALGSGGALFVNIGSPTNACQPIGQDRQEGVMGEDPCTQLETRAGVWRFDANRMHQTQADGERWATGIRNAVALAVNPADDALYAVQHGRDQLDMWEGFTPEDNAEGPAEELQRLTQGADFGWPYCFFDTRLEKRVLAPEYGGDGQEVGRCADFALPLVALPGHWAPNDLIFYTGSHFPAQYRGGAFIAFHGSWNRAPMPQAGYRVVFVPFSGSTPSENWETFADGFAGENPSPEAEHRPMGLAQAPDGSLYIADSNGGRVWRVFHRGAEAGGP
jgi:glucose/arabinose dehydrogenase